MLYRWFFYSHKCQALYRLMRIDKPAGLFLLLWPVFWALWLSELGFPNFKVLIIFILGTFFMRTAGCVINDYFDYKIDRKVKRTAQRPLPSGIVNKKETKLIFIVLIIISFILVMMFNYIVVFLSVIALILTFIYPFMKRYIHLPQLILGISFSWSIPMVFMAVKGSLPVNCWLLFLANICWTIAYDTQYAMIDRNDDLCIGVRSTAIFFGKFDKLIIGLLQLITLILFVNIGWRMKFSFIFYLTLIGVLILFVWQHKLIIKRNPKFCFKAFLSNNFVGMLFFIGIILGLKLY